MDTDAAFAVVDVALRFGFVNRMDQATAELERLGWISEPMDADGSCLDHKWQYPQSDNMWRVHTGRVGPEFFVGLMVNTDRDSTAGKLADSIRSVIDQWSESAEVRYTRDGASDLWTDEFRVIELQVHPGYPAEPSLKAVPPAMQLAVSNVEG